MNAHKPVLPDLYPTLQKRQRHELPPEEPKAALVRSGSSHLFDGRGGSGVGESTTMTNEDATRVVQMNCVVGLSAVRSGACAARKGRKDRGYPCVARSKE